MNTSLYKFILYWLLGLCPALVSAQDGRLYVEQFKNEMEADNQEVDLTMQLFSKSGTLRERQLSWSTMTDSRGQSMSYLIFTAPADIRGTAFLSQENKTGNDDQWLFLPALKRSRRISSNEKNQSFLGSDFTYDDLGDENIDQCRYTVLRTEPSAQGAIRVIEAVYTDPVKMKESGYSKRILSIEETTHMLVRCEYFGPAGEAKKMLECSEFKQFGEYKKWRPLVYRMTNLEKGTKTILKFNSYSINKGIDPGRFTLRYLEGN